MEEVLLTIQDAVQYVWRHKEVKISPAALARRITRGMPHQRDENYRILVSPETLDKMRFRPRYYTVGSRKVYFKDIKPVPIKSTRDLKLLEQKYGELTNEAGLIDLLEQLTGHRYTRGAIKQRRERGAIYYAGYDPTKRGVYWYPVNQILSLNWQPELGIAQKRVA